MTWGAKSQPSAQSFGARIRDLRIKRGLSMERLAHLTRTLASQDSGRGLSFSYISLLERGERRPTPWVIEALATSLGVRATDFGEFRLALVRALFDEQTLGRSQALDNLALMDAAVASGRATDNTSQASRGFSQALATDSRHDPGGF